MVGGGCGGGAIKHQVTCLIYHFRCTKKIKKKNTPLLCRLLDVLFVFLFRLSVSEIFCFCLSKVVSLDRTFIVVLPNAKHYLQNVQRIKSCRITQRMSYNNKTMFNEPKINGVYGVVRLFLLPFQRFMGNALKCAHNLMNVMFLLYVYTYTYIRIHVYPFPTLSWSILLFVGFLLENVNQNERKKEQMNEDASQRMNCIALQKSISIRFILNKNLWIWRMNEDF